MSAASTICLRRISLDPRMTALQVISTFGLQSLILWATDSAENPAKTTWKKSNLQYFDKCLFKDITDCKHQKSSNKGQGSFYHTEWTAPIRDTKIVKILKCQN